MLRITILKTAQKDVILYLEGRLINGWVSEMHYHCTQLLAQQHQLTLDLASVSFADEAGIALLKRLMDGGVQLTGCSLFLSQLLMETHNS